MKIPCVERIPFLVEGLMFLSSALTDIQYSNLTLIASALVLGAKFNLSEINRMWLKEKSVSTLSHFLSDAKFSTTEMQDLYARHAFFRHQLIKRKGYFLIDDTMMHHSKFCQWLHGVGVLFDHALGTNLKARCIIVLYYSDGAAVKFPITFRIYYQKSSKMLWARKYKSVYKTKNELASEMLEWALAKGYPPCTVLADSWFGVGPFIKSLKRLNLSYVIEVQSSSKARVACKERKLTPTGRIAKKQYDLKTLPDFFQSIENISACGFDVDEKNKKPAKVLYHTKVSNIRLNSIVGKHRVVESINPATKTTKYLLTNELTWESSKTISTYSYRWVIEEFFRNAKQLLDMEGVNVRSEQGITTALCLVFYIDFLLHLENCENIAESSQKESKTVPSIIRRFQHENQLKFIEKVQLDEEFIRKWISVESDKVDRNRKTHKDLIEIPYQSADRQLRAAS